MSTEEAILVFEYFLEENEEEFLELIEAIQEIRLDYTAEMKFK